MVRISSRSPALAQSPALALPLSLVLISSAWATSPATKAAHRGAAHAKAGAKARAKAHAKAHAKTASKTAKTTSKTAKTASKTAKTASKTAKTASKTAKTASKTARPASQASLRDGERAAPAYSPTSPTPSTDDSLRAMVRIGEAVWKSQNQARDRRLSATRPPKKVNWFKARRRSRLPENISHGLAMVGPDRPVRPRRSFSIRTQKVDEGETIRSVAYKACTSPQVLASLNDLEWDTEGTPLPAGIKLKVPLRFRAFSGFAKAQRLRTGPGVLAKRVHNTWGRPYVVKLLTSAFRVVHQRWPGRHPFIVHDVSLFGGGRLGRHKSHRAGRDIDIGYPTFDAERKDWGMPALSRIDYGRLWAFIDHIEQSGYVAAIYMSPRIQRRLHAYAVTQGVDKARLDVLFQYPCARGQKRTLIRHSPGHRDHMHVRFAAPKDLGDLQS